MQYALQSRHTVLPCQQAAPPQGRNRDRQNDIQHDGQDQCVPRHRDRGDAQQQGNDGRKGKHHDDVVECHLCQGKAGMAFGEITPDKDHCRTGCGGKDNQAGDVAVDLLGGQPVGEQGANKQPAQ